MYIYIPAISETTGVHDVLMHPRYTTSYNLTYLTWDGLSNGRQDFQPLDADQRKLPFSILCLIIEESLRHQKLGILYVMIS